MNCEEQIRNELYHHGILGQKWGVRRSPAQLGINKSDSSVTKKVKKEYNSLSDNEFKAKYQASKATYAKRVSKYGDPYMNAPLAKLGKKLQAMQQQKVSKLAERKSEQKRGEVAATRLLQLQGKTTVKLTAEQKSKIVSGEVSYYLSDGTPVKVIGFD